MLIEFGRKEDYISAIIYYAITDLSIAGVFVVPPSGGTLAFTRFRLKTVLHTSKLGVHYCVGKWLVLRGR